MEEKRVGVMNENWESNDAYARQVVRSGFLASLTIAVFHAILGN